MTRLVRFLRFADLQAYRVVTSWPQLKRLQTLHGFPRGRMLSPNIRAWTEDEVSGWIASRPVENDRPLLGASKTNDERRRKALQWEGEPQAKIEPPRPRGAASRRTRSKP